MAITIGGTAVSSKNSNVNCSYSATIEEKSVDTSNNKSVVSWSLNCVQGGSVRFTGSTRYKAGIIKLWINGTEVYSNYVKLQSYGTGQSVASGSGEITIEHDDSGDKTITCTIDFNEGYDDYSTYGYYWLDGLPYSSDIKLTHIDRSFTSTPTFTVSNITDTTCTLSWETSETCSKIVVSGATAQTITPNAKSGTINITGLTAGKTNTVTLTMTRSDTGVAKAFTKDVSTSSLPYVTEINNFSVGDPCVVKLYNPYGRTVTINLLDWGTRETIVSTTFSGTDFSGFNDSASIKALADIGGNYVFSIPFCIQLVYDGSVIDTSLYAYYSSDKLAPTINSISITELNKNVSDRAGENLTLRYISKKKVEVDCEAGASATMTTVAIKYGTQTLNASLDSSSGKYVATFENLDSGDIVVTCTDKRTAQTSKSISQDFYPYEYPTLSVFTVERENEMSSNGKLNIKGTFYSLFSNYVTFCFDRVDGTSSQTEATTETTEPTLTNNEYSMSKSYTDLDYQYSYKFLFKITDAFGSVVNNTFNLGLGRPTLYLGKDKVAIYNDLDVANDLLARNSIETNKLTVSGDTTINGKETISGDVAVGGKVDISSEDYQMTIENYKYGSRYGKQVTSSMLGVITDFLKIVNSNGENRLGLHDTGFHIRSTECQITNYGDDNRLDIIHPQSLSIRVGTGTDCVLLNLTPTTATLSRYMSGEQFVIAKFDGTTLNFAGGSGQKITVQVNGNRVITEADI